MGNREEIYKRTVRWATIIALSLNILLFQLFPTMNRKKAEEPKIVFTNIEVENIPITRQGTRKPPPPKPAVPIPSDDELFPEDLTIEETELDLNLYSELPGKGLAPSAPVIYQPRPIYEVIPDYPEELQKKGIQGMVKLHIHINKFGYVDQVIVLENTTGSPLCAESARKAALQGRYIPAKSKGKPTDIWITRTYRFGVSK